MSTSTIGSRSRGFNLIEIVVVLALLALAALLVAPSFTRGMRGVELRAAARDLVTHMKRARTKAISTQTVHRIVLGVDENQRPYYAMTDEYEAVLKTYTMPQWIAVLPDGDQTLPLKFSFYPNGRGSGGTFAIGKADGRKLALSVDPVTGFGRVVKNEEER